MDYGPAVAGVIKTDAGVELTAYIIRNMAAPFSRCQRPLQGQGHGIGDKSINSSDNRGRFYNILFDAWMQEDRRDYEAIAADMMAHGFEKKGIEQAMRSRLKKREEFTEQAEAVRGEVAADLQGSRAYQGLSPEYRDKAMEAAEDYPLFP